MVGLYQHRMKPADDDQLGRDRKKLFTEIHTWYGRGLLLLGMLNGGLGLQLANNTSMGIRGAYAAIVVCVLIAYTGVQVWWHLVGRHEAVARQERKEQQDKQGDGTV
jgi:hypothetical protein